MTISLKLAAFLRAVRKSKNKSQHESSIELGVNQCTYSRLESGQQWTLKTMVKVSEWAGLTIVEMIDAADKHDPHVHVKQFRISKKVTK